MFWFSTAILTDAAFNEGQLRHPGFSDEDPLTKLWPM